MTKLDRKGRLKGAPSMSDTNLLLTITVAAFFLMYISAVVFLGGGFSKPQTFLHILNNNASLIVLACGMSIVMITGGIDISVGAVTCLVCMTSAVILEKQGGSLGTVVHWCPWASAWPMAWCRASWWRIWRSSPSSCLWPVCSLPRA